MYLDSGNYSIELELVNDTNISENQAIDSTLENPIGIVKQLDSLLTSLEDEILRSDLYLATELVNKIEFLIQKDSSILYLQLIKFNYLKGLKYYQEREWRQANYHFSLVYLESVKHEKDSLASNALKSLGNVLFQQGEFEQAINYYRHALSYNPQHSRNYHSFLSSIYQNLGISYAMLGNNDSALIYLKKSINLKEQYLLPDNPKLASGYLNLSRFLQVNGELTEALDIIDKAEGIYMRLYGDNNIILAPLYLNKGSILITLNDYESALHYHQLAFDLYKMAYDRGEEIFQQLYLNFGVIYNSLERYSESLKYLELSLEGNISIEHEIKSNFTLGSVLLNLGDIQNAKTHFKKSIDLSREKLGDINVLTANTYLNYGSFLEQIGEMQEAIYSYEKAASIYEKIFGQKNRDLSNSYYLKASVLLRENKIVESLVYYQKSLTSNVDDFDVGGISENPDLQVLDSDLNIFYCLNGKSNALYQLFKSDATINNLKASLNTAEVAINLLEKIKSTLQGENTKLLINSKASEIYNLAVTVASELYQLTGDQEYLKNSFRYSEKSKAAVLLSSVKQMEAVEVGNLPEDVKLKEKSLKRAISQYQNIIYEENQKTVLDSAKIARIRNKLFESKLLYDSLIVYLEANYPEYYNLKYNFDVIDISSIQSILEKEQTLVEYKLTDSLLYTFIINRDSVVLIRKPISPDFRDSVNSYRNMMSKLPQADSLSYRSFSFARKGYYLSNVLELNNPLIKGSANLVVIPDDILGYLSFDALVTELPDPERCSYSKLSYLIKRSSLTYGYSGTLLFGRNDKVGKSRKVLAVAPTYDNLSVQNFAQRDGAFEDLESFLIPLPNTQNEVTSISTIYNTDLLVGDAASETEFKSMASGYSILHFAMHTLINDEDPLASKLVFSPDHDTVNDGFLNTYEIYNLDLNAELAVLSACRTGTGKLSKGEGIMSLARGFLYAGVPGIIMTLWAVEDISGADIVSTFYQNLHNGQPKDLALRNSKLTYLENADQLRAHPYFWAAYVQIGDNGPIVANNITRNYLYAAGLSLFLALFLGVVLLKSRRPPGS